MEASRRRRRADVQQWQPLLWAAIVGLLLIAAYLIAFVIKNDEEVPLDFVFDTAHVSLIWLILLCLALGVIAGLLLSQLYRRRARRPLPGFPKEPPASPPPAEQRG